MILFDSLFMGYSRIRNFIDYCREFGLSAACTIVKYRKQTSGIVSVSISGIKTAVHYRPNTSDFMVLRQVLGRKEYNFGFEYVPRRIIDGGANVGYASLYFATRFPSAEIVALEPNSTNCTMFKKNCCSYRNIRLLDGALWSSDSTVDLMDESAQAFAFRVHATPLDHSGNANSVPGYSLSTVLQLFDGGKADILKLDIEGAELELFTSSDQEWLWKVRTLIVELHERFRPGVTEAFHALISKRPHRLERSGEYLIVHFDSSGY